MSIVSAKEGTDTHAKRDTTRVNRNVLKYTRKNISELSAKFYCKNSNVM